MPDREALERRLLAELASAPDREAARVILDDASWWLLGTDRKVIERIYTSAENILAEIPE